MSINKEKVFILILLFLTGFFHYKLKERPKEREIESYAKFIGTTYKYLDKIPFNFELELLNGEKFILSDIIGKKIIIFNFLTTWCGACLEELPELNKFYKKYKENLILIGIFVKENEITVKEFLTKNKVEFPVGIDESGEISYKYEIKAYPTTILIGVNGKIQLYEIGAIYNTEVSLVPLVNKNLENLKEGKTITKEEYLKQEKLVVEFYQLRTDETKKITEREKSIAKKIYCPRGCGRNLIDCNCSMCKKVIEEIREEIEKGTPDKEIVRKINLKYCEVK